MPLCFNVFSNSAHAFSMIRLACIFHLAPMCPFFCLFQTVLGSTCADDTHWIPPWSGWNSHVSHCGKRTT
jgi:hypothetical protein